MDKTKISYLGPVGSFSHVAAEQEHKGNSLVPKKTISEVFSSVKEKETDLGVVAIENSTGGSVEITIDELIKGNYFINKEFFVTINQCLLSNYKKNEIKEIFSYSQGFAQCRDWLKNNFPNADLIEVSSTSRGAELASQKPYSAAIASEIAAKEFKVKVLEKNINDDLNNSTRFITISLSENNPKNKKKTGMIFGIKNKPGALFDILLSLKENKINMTKLESRPSRKQKWEYLFFVEIEGNLDEENIKKAITKIKENTIELKILGSY